MASGQWSVASFGLRVRGFLANGHWTLITGVAVLLATGHWTLATCAAAIFPDQIGDFTKGAPKALAIPDQALYNEYGLVATEQAEYAGPATGPGNGKRFTATAWRFHDSTGAMAVFQARRPSGATPAKVADLAVQTSDGEILAFGNYVFQFTGSVPAAADLEELYAHVPELERAPLPALAGFLPQGGLIPNSERYVVGPVSLQRFEPRIPPSLAAFHLSAEAQLAKYQSPKGPLTLVIFEYPTPNMARDKYQEFQNIPGAVVKRAGPLVGIIIQPPDADAAERVLGQLRYEAKLTENQKIPKDESKGFARLILNIFVVSGVLIGLSILLGIAFGGSRVLLRKLGIVRKEDEELTVLHLGPK